MRCYFKEVKNMKEDEMPKKCLQNGQKTERGDKDKNVTV